MTGCECCASCVAPEAAPINVETAARVVLPEAFKGAKSKMKIACVQMTSACDPADNLPVIAARIKQAAAQGARLVALPETCSFMEKNRKAMQARLKTRATAMCWLRFAIWRKKIHFSAYWLDDFGR